MNTEALRISCDKDALDIDLIHRFLRDHAPWAIGIPRTVVERAIEGSLCFGAYVGNRQIGFARLVTDRATFAYLCDVFILPEFQSRGYAAALMDHIFALEFVQGLRRVVLVTSNAHGLYSEYGFKALAHPEKYMELHRPDVYAPSHDR